MVKNLAIKCRGLPFSCTEADLRSFLGDSGIEAVELPIREGKAAGEATVTYNNDRDYNEALKKDHEYMGHRWIEVFPADEEGSKKPRGPRPERPGGDRAGGGDRGADRGARYNGPEERFGRYGETCIRIRGLPYSARESDVFEFFRGIPMLPDGVLLADDPKKGNGEAFVVFEDERGGRSAKALHMKSMGRRYIEVFDAPYSEMIRFCQDNRLRVPRPPPPGGIPGYGYESPFAQGGYGDRRGPAPGPPPFEGYVATPAVAGSDPYYGGGAPSYPARPAADPYAPRADPYAPPRDEPYGRPPAAATDPYARSDPYANRGAYGDAFGRPAYAPTPGGPAADPYARPGEGTWRDDRGPPQPAGYAPPTMAMEGYGYGEYGAQPSAGGGPMKREAAAPAWRAAEYERPVAEAPRGRERPGQRYVLKMRGVPFRAVETDVYEFFEPIRPSRVEIVREPGGRPSGEARVEFESRKDYDEALLKDKQYMGQRYVELFPDFGGRY